MSHVAAAFVMNRLGTLRREHERWKLQVYQRLSEGGTELPILLVDHHAGLVQWPAFQAITYLHDEAHRQALLALEAAGDCDWQAMIDHLAAMEHVSDRLVQRSGQLQDELMEGLPSIALS